MQRFLPLVLLLAVGCAPMDWMRSDAAPEQVQADMQACRDQAWRESRWPTFAFADPFGRRYLNWPYTAPFADPYGERFLEEARLANFCMRAKGYELAPVTQ
jgi:hypothetical protein